MTDNQPEGTLLAVQLGDAVGGPGTPDPETPLSDAEHAIGQVIRLAGSWQMAGGRLDASHVAGVLLRICAQWTGGLNEALIAGRTDGALPGMELPVPAPGSPVAVATEAGEGKDGTEGDEGDEGRG